MKRGRLEIGLVSIGEEVSDWVAEPLDDTSRADAAMIADRLDKNFFFRKSGMVMEAINQIAPLLRKRTRVETTLSPEVIKLKEQETAAKNALINLQREAMKLKTERSAELAKQNASFQGCFVDQAKLLLPPSDFAALVEMAQAESRNRQSKL